MKYFEVTFHINPATEISSDLLSALLADDGFEAFETTAEGLMAWIQQPMFVPENVDAAIESFPLPDTQIAYSVKDAPDENWNQQWEQEGFRPIIIRAEDNAEGQGATDAGNEGPALIVIHDTRHTDVPEASYEILINPCQAFGTGSHQTTRMILRQLLAMPMEGRQVIDAGTGTGILAILCHMLGASKVLAYDLDEWSVRNAQSNLLLNGIESNVDVLLGDSSVLSPGGAIDSEMASELGRSFSPTLLIANINRNILLADMSQFASSLAPEGELLLSGFYSEDVPALLAEASKYGLKPILQTEDNNWTLLLLKKEKYS